MQVTIGFNYVKQKSSKEVYKYDYKFDTIGKQKRRSVWLLKEEAQVNDMNQYEHNYDEEQITQTAQIVQVCCGDNIRISINFLNLSGLMNLDSIQWEAPLVESVQKLELSTSQKKNNPRVCYLERLYKDWILFDYFPYENKVKVDKFSPKLVLKEARCAGIDTVVNRMIYIAEEKGSIEKSSFGVPVVIVSGTAEVTVEVKKYGLISDLQCPLILRRGDQLMYYLTKGD